MTKADKLAKSLDFKTLTELHDYLIDSHINGNFTQCRELFAEMSKKDQQRFLSNTEMDKKIYSFYLLAGK